MELIFNPNLSAGAQLELGLRLAAGLVLGALIGLERELHRQPAGFRTHSLVALGSALFAIVSAYGYSGANVDPTRITAQIVSGIGFIGAGTILQFRGHIRGLTTAASLWAVAAIGMATGVRSVRARRGRHGPDPRRAGAPRPRRGVRPAPLDQRDQRGRAGCCRGAPHDESRSEGRMEDLP